MNLLDLKDTCQSVNESNIFGESDGDLGILYWAQCSFELVILKKDQCI